MTSLFKEMSRRSYSDAIKTFGRNLDDEPEENTMIESFIEDVKDKSLREIAKVVVNNARHHQTDVATMVNVAIEEGVKLAYFYDGEGGFQVYCVEILSNEYPLPEDLIDKEVERRYASCFTYAYRRVKEAFEVFNRFRPTYDIIVEVFRPFYFAKSEQGTIPHHIELKIDSCNIY